MAKNKPNFSWIRVFRDKINKPYRSVLITSTITDKDTGESIVLETSNREFYDSDLPRIEQVLVMSVALTSWLDINSTMKFCSSVLDDDKSWIQENIDTICGYYTIESKISKL